jgi:hypothetical protein
MSETQADFVDDIVQDELPQHIQPPRDDFKAWHKVRKQFIREEQWNKLISRMVYRLRQPLQDEASNWTLDQDEIADGDAPSEIPDAILIERPLRCLVLPGDDLLDLRALWSDIRRHQCWIRYLGFNEAQGSQNQETRVYVSNNEVTSLNRVATDSQVLPDRFQSIANMKSQAYHYLRQYGPFHVVNLDLCDSLFPTTAVGRTEYYNALYRLAEYQMKNQTTPWLLFITTQVEPSLVQANELEQMCGPTRTNCDTHDDFTKRLGTIVPVEAFQTQGAAIDLSKLNEEQMIRVFGVALGKWLMHLAASASPQWFVDVQPCYRYGIRENPHVEMLSLAFLFKPNFKAPIDATGLSNLSVQPQDQPDELGWAIKLVSAIEKMADVDDLLRSNDELRASMETASADLLASAGYDREKYLGWPDRYYG